jgi:hypothetical protein
MEDTMSVAFDNLAGEVRAAAEAIGEKAQSQRCYSVIQATVAAALDHLTAQAGNIEKTARIVELEAERDQALRLHLVLKDEKDELWLERRRMIAERDKLKAALRELETMTVCTSTHVYVGDGVFEDWQQLSRQIIAAALSDPSVKEKS